MSAAFKLETFDAPAGTAKPRASGGMDLAAAEAALRQRIARASGVARARGFEEGAASAAAAYDEEMVQAGRRLAEAFEDADMIAVEARETALTGLGDVMLAVFDAVAPGLGAEALAEELADQIADAARTAAQSGVTVVVAPEMVDAAARAVQRAGIKADVQADGNIGALAARIVFADGFDQIDLGERIAAARDALEAYFADVRERRAHV